MTVNLSICVGLAGKTALEAAVADAVVNILEKARQESDGYEIDEVIILSKLWIYPWQIKFKVTFVNFLNNLSV